MGQFADLDVADLCLELRGAWSCLLSLARPGDIQSVVSAGARFAVTPGTTLAMLEEIARWDIALLPGASTPSEILTLMDFGYYQQKIFPVDHSGGIKYLESLSGPFPEVHFCPSGGICSNNFLDYLALLNVFCVSGSWMTPTSFVENSNWAAITRLALETSRQLA